MNDDIVTLSSYSSSIEANIIAGRLESEGIPCFVTDEFMHSVKPLPTHIAGVRVRVFERDLEKARNILTGNAVDGQNSPDGHKNYILCPICQSSNISPGVAVNNIFAWLHLLLSAVLFFRAMRLKKFICNNCGHRFQHAQDVG